MARKFTREEMKISVSKGLLSLYEKNPEFFYSPTAIGGAIKAECSGRSPTPKDIKEVLDYFISGEGSVEENAIHDYYGNHVQKGYRLKSSHLEQLTNIVEQHP